MESEPITGLISQFFIALLLVVPLWKICKKAGKIPALSLFLFLPYVGLFIVSLLLAFSRWPATETAVNANEQNRPEG